MKLALLIPCIAGFCLPCANFAQTPSPQAAQAPAFGTLSIDPSCAYLAGGRASLIVKPLTRLGGIYTGDYQLKVIPYFFKSEKGKISILFSDDSLHEITQGKPAKFAGTSTTNGSGKIRPIVGIATPLVGGRGSVTFSIKTESGALVFTSAYKVADK